MDFSQFVRGDFLDLHSKTINISELVRFLQSNPNITKLSLKRCYIDDEGAKALANGNLANLTQLDLSSNIIGDEGAKALANGNLTNLTSLNLSFNDIGDEGAKALANGNLKNLTSLDVSCNNIGDEGAEALADLKKVDVKGTENFRIIDSLINKFTQSNSSIEIFDPAKSKSKTTLDDIIISKSLREELNKICGFISEGRRALLQKIGCKPQKGYIFYGPPGNGKTSIARAIAYQANAKFISVSAPEFMKSYIGEGEAHVRKLFKEARANAPCIVFIDEIDCIAKERGKGGNSTAAQSSERLVNQLLAELDGFNPLEDVTVIAATNFKDVLDKALIRSGRLSKHIEIPLPEKRQRKEILDFYIKKLKNSGYLEGTIDTTKLANETDGFSGADLEYLTYETVENVVLNSKDEEKVIIDTSNFINTIKGLKKNKSQEPEGKQVNDGLESFNNLLDNADNVESHSSANSSSDVVVTQQLAKVTKLLNGIQTKINALQKEREERFEELDSRNSDLEQGLDSVRKDLIKVTQCTKEYTQLKDNLKTITTKITECAEEHTQLKDNNLKTITEKYTQLKSELESMVTTELKKHESTLETPTMD